MKKLLTISSASVAVLGMTLCSCDGVRTERYDIADMKNSTIADSMMYYSGQMRAAEYWDDALDNDTLSHPGIRKEFLEGVEDGMMLHSRNEVYNKGFKLGQRIADNCRRLSVRYGLDFNPGIVYKSLRSGLRADTVVNLSEARKQFYALMNKCEAIHSDKVLASATKTLSREVKNLGMTRINDYLYGKQTLEGTGEPLKIGDNVRAVINITTMDGDKIPFPEMENFAVGDRYMNKVFTEALLTMSPGEVKKFAVPAIILIGENCMEYDLKPSETLLVTIKVFSEA